MTQVRWGVLGTARIAELQVIPAIVASDNGTVAAVSSSSGRAAAYADRLGIPAAYDSHDELLADPDIGAVYIPLPNTLHAEWTKRAAAAGKHVLCEKPIAMSPAELADVESVCHDHGVQLAEAFMYRHHPQIEVVRYLLESGRIGRLVAIDARFHFQLDPADGPNIRLDPALGGGAVRDVGCYPIDLANLLIDSAPTDVSAMSVTAGGVDTTTAGTLLYDRAVIASFSCGFDAPAGDSALLIGTAGTIALRHPFRPDRGGATVIVTASDGTSETHDVPGDLYRIEVEKFARRVLANESDEVDLELSRRTVETTSHVLEAATYQTSPSR
jgi:D-xylose 1-dehydrogenase (NADP+, D-xylono-1,5-lactone-forming)